MYMEGFPIWIFFTVDSHGWRVPHYTDLFLSSSPQELLCAHVQAKGRVAPVIVIHSCASDGSGGSSSASRLAETVPARASKGHGVRAARAAKMVTGVDPAAGPSVPSLTVAAGVLKG